MTTIHLKKQFQFSAVLGFLGMAVTTYLIYQHYKTPGSSFCNVSDFVSCDVVNKSLYSELFGIPVSMLGFATYAFLFAVSLLLARGVLAPQRFIPVLFSVSGFGLLFSLYLTYVEFFILWAVCIFCITQQILIAVLFINSSLIWRKLKHSYLSA